MCADNAGTASARKLSEGPEVCSKARCLWLHIRAERRTSSGRARAVRDATRHARDNILAHKCEEENLSEARRQALLEARAKGGASDSFALSDA